MHIYRDGGIPKLTPDSYLKDYGFITDYFCEIMHELRKTDVLGPLKSRFNIVDAAKATAGLSGRDLRAIMKTTSALVKLLYPHGSMNDAELEEVLLLSCELRQRVRDQLHVMAPGEYDRVKIGAALLPSGKIATPILEESGRVQKITLPPHPAVGEVMGLAVEEDHGCILRFEIQATKGNGRIVPLGSIQRVMREYRSRSAIHSRQTRRDSELQKNGKEDLMLLYLQHSWACPKRVPLLVLPSRPE